MDWIDEQGQQYPNCVVVFKVADEYGELSNMAGGFPLRVNEVAAPSAEALYQACRFPHRPDWQREILSQASPMAAKMMSKKEGRRKNQTRPDWDRIEAEVMRWVLRVKLAQHYRRIAALLRATADRPIVEKSRKDAHWGAVEREAGQLRGRNLLGRLLMELRGLVLTSTPEALATVPPPALPDFLLLGQPVQAIQAR